MRPLVLAALAALLAAPAVAQPVLQPTLLGEVDYRVYPSELEGSTGFALARLRPGLLFTPAAWAMGIASLEVVGEVPTVLDAYLRLRGADWLQFDVGYSKTPLFASYVYEPDQTTPFPDRSPVLSTFGVRRDLGVDAHFSPRTLPIEAWLRVGNGTGSALGNDNALPAGYASLDFVSGRAWRGASPSQRAWGLRLGLGAFVESPRDRDGEVGQTPLGFIYARPIVVSGLREMGEAHAVLYAGAARLTVEAALAHDSRSRDDDGNPATPRLTLPSLRSYGATAELAFVLHGYPREVGRAPRGDSGAQGLWQRSALELSARYDGLWLDRSADDVQPQGSQGGALALKWWPSEFLAATLASYLTHYDQAPVEEPDRRWSFGLITRVSFFWGLPG